MAVFQLSAGAVLVAMFIMSCGTGCHAGKYYRRYQARDASDSSDSDQEPSSPSHYRSPSYGDQGSRSTSCVRVVPGHYYRTYGVKVSTCDALLEQQEAVEALDLRVDRLAMDLAGEANSLSGQVDFLRGRVDDLQGVNKLSVPIQLFKNLPNNGTDTRLVCQINSELEAMEMCRILGFRIPKPYYFHLSCDDPQVADLDIDCPDTTWVFPPGCVRPGGDLIGCATDPAADFTCTDILFLGCDGCAPSPGRMLGSMM